MKVKKLLAIGLTMAMFLSTGSQALADASSQEVSAEKQVSVSKSTVEPKSYNANATSGNCGDSMTWSYNESTGVLSISGSGEMTSHPWDEFKNSIEKVVFSGNITSICNFAFNKCINLDRITIPATVETIGGGSFLNCINLESVTFASGSKLTTINTTYDFVSGTGYDDYGAFQGCKNLEKIQIPNSVTFIGKYGFLNCTNLETVILSDNLGAIKTRTFAGCENLKSITLGSNTTSIEDYAFKNCNKMASVKLNSGLKTIGNFAFHKCNSLINISVPASVEKIGGGAFLNCINLESVTFASGSKLISINTTYDFIENTGYNDYGAFEGCTNLKKIVIPNSVTFIGKYAFLNCTNLGTVILSDNLESIKTRTFAGCENLKSITLGSNTTSIEDYAFKNCNKMASVNLNNGLKTIGNFAFRQCNSLMNISIPASVEKIGGGAFYGLSQLKSVTFAYDSKLTAINTSYDFIENIGYNDYGTFQGCESLSSMVLPDNVTAINKYAFKGCTGLKSVIIGKHVTDIGNGAFAGCTNLANVVIPKAVNTVQENAFLNCSSLNTVKYTGSESRWNTLKSDGINTKGNSYLLNAPNYIFNYVPAISSISIKTKPEKLSYTVGEKLNTTGLVLNVNYEDGSGQTVDEGFTCSPSVLNTVGNDQKVTVTYKGKTAVFSVSVSQAKKTVKTVSIASKPSKLTYKVGETLNTDGLKLLITYSDGSTATVTSGFTCTPTKLSTAGTQKITVTYDGKTTSFNVTVNEIKKTVKTVSIASKPSKLTYKVGETLNTDGLKLLITYSDGSTATVTSGFTCTPTKLSTAGTQKITVKFNDKNTSFNVTVNEIKKTVKTVSIASKPSKLTYKVGETLNTDGLKLLITYSDGSTATVTSGFTCTPTKLSTAGTQKITVTYEGKTTSFNVTVNEIKKTVKTISIASKPAKLTYKVGETLNTDGLKLLITYSDGSTATVTSGFTCIPTKLSTVGTQKITVKYNDKSTSFNVTVNKANKTVKSIKIKSKPTKLKYKTGEKLNTKGLKLTVTYTDKSTATITSGFTCSPTNLSKAGTQKITVNYNGKTASFNVTVNQVKKTVKSIKIGTKPTKLKYKVGEKLNTNGLKLTVTYTDNSTATVTSGFTCSPTKLSKAGTKKITVKYKGKTTSFNVTVSKVVKSIKIKSKPSKLKYKTGETLNTNGLKLTVTYTDKSTKTISSGFTCSPTAFTKVGTQKITVKYGGKSASFNVTVSKGKTTSNTLPKLTKDNVAKELEKQIRWYAAYRNSFTLPSFKKTGGNVAFTDSNDDVYYRVYDFNSIKEVQNELSKYMIVPTNCVKQRSALKEKSGKLYATEFYGGVLAYDLKSVTLKEFKNNAYYVYVNVYEVTEYYNKDLLKVVEKDGQYKIESFVEGNTDYYPPRDMDSHPERKHLVAGLGD